MPDSENSLAHRLEAVAGGRLAIDHESFADPSDTRFARFVDFWSRLADRVGGYPARTDLDPTCLDRDLFPHIFLADIERKQGGRTRYRYRLLGGAIVEVENAKRGECLDEMTQADISHIEQHYEAAIKGQIYMRRSNLGWRSKGLEFRTYSVIALPLSDDGQTPTCLLGLCLYD